FKPFSDLDGSSSSFSEFGLLGCRGYLNVTDSTSKAQRAGCLLKKIMQIIELRVSHQAESIKNGIEMHDLNKVNLRKKRNLQIRIFSESRYVNWKNKEHIYLSFVDCQSRAFQVLSFQMVKWLKQKFSSVEKKE
ncbi:hypothetical protein HN873_069726, partial [Arachis hypogaea]